MSTCAVVLELLDDYVDGELQPSDMRRVQTHLAQCDGCAAEFRRARREVDAVRERLRRVPVPPDLRARLGAAIRELSSNNLH
jgi:anti-sigma factor (TIGR02949 family)